MKLSIKVASTSVTVNVFIQDSSSTTGAGLTGLVYNSGSLTAYYGLPRAAAVAITLATQTVTGAYSSGGFVEISSANMPGWYRLDIPDAALASGRFTSIHLKGAANMAPLPIEIELTGWDNQDAVRGGMTALPNAVPGAAGGVFIAGSNAATTANITGNLTGNVTGSVGSVAGNVSGNLLGTLSTTERTAIADALLNRNMASVSDTNARSPLNALRFLRNKKAIAATVLTVTKEDDTTTAWVADLVLNAAAVPVTEVDPTT